MYISPDCEEHSFGNAFSWVHPTAKEIREILSEEHPFYRYKIAERIFDKYAGEGEINPRQIKVSKKEIEELGDEFF